jgi:hypothetical protein
MGPKKRRPRGPLPEPWPPTRPKRAARDLLVDQLTRAWPLATWEVLSAGRYPDGVVRVAVVATEKVRGQPEEGAEAVEPVSVRMTVSQRFLRALHRRQWLAQHMGQRLLEIVQEAGRGPEEVPREVREELFGEDLEGDTEPDGYIRPL